MLALALSLFLDTAEAKELAGVTLADTATVGGQSLVLNGMGLREKYFFDIYVGGLYLPAKTTDATKAIGDDVPKRMVMHFIYSSVTKQQMVDTFEEGIVHQTLTPELRADWTKLEGYLSDLVAGDQIVYEYVPGTGTTVTVKGVNKGTIAGDAFMKSLFTLYLGTHPPTAALKAGMMGK